MSFGFGIVEQIFEYGCGGHDEHAGTQVCKCPAVMLAQRVEIDSLVTGFALGIAAFVSLG